MDIGYIMEQYNEKKIKQIKMNANKKRTKLLFSSCFLLLSNRIYNEKSRKKTF